MFGEKRELGREWVKGEVVDVMEKLEIDKRKGSRGGEVG